MIYSKSTLASGSQGINNSKRRAVVSEHKLTGKQKKFCIEYLKDLNATQAAIRAGYSEDTAYSIGWENLKKPEIKEIIDKELETAMGESRASLKARIIGELKDVAFTDSGIELLKNKDGDIYDIRITDKLKAIDMLGKYLGIWTDKIELSTKDDKPLKMVMISEIMGNKDA
jgi:phage terminase small subunit